MTARDGDVAARVADIVGRVSALAAELDGLAEAAYQRVAGHPHNDYDAGMQTAYDAAADWVRDLISAAALAEEGR